MSGEQETSGGESTIESMATEVAIGLGFEAEAAPAPAEPAEEAPAAAAEAPASPDPAVDPNQKPADAEKPAETAAPPAPDDPTLKTPPSTWRPTALADWEKLTPVARAEIIKREEDIARRASELKSHEQVASGFFESLKPHLPAYQQMGADLWQVQRDAINAHAMLTFGNDEQKLQTLSWIANQAGVDVSRLATGAPQSAAEATISQLRQEIRELRNGVQGVTSQITTERAKELESQVLEFSKTHEHFETVALDMKQLLESGVCKSLEDAYNNAVWTNPVTRAKELEKQAGELSARKSREAQERAEKARKATSVNVVSRDSGGRTTSPVGTIDDTLAEAMAAIKSR